MYGVHRKIKFTIGQKVNEGYNNCVNYKRSLKIVAIVFCSSEPLKLGDSTSLAIKSRLFAAQKAITYHQIGSQIIYAMSIISYHH